MKVIIITGQTATGKTKLALELAQDHDGELVNCDSRQIYKGLDIITGKDIDKGSKFTKVSALGNFDIGYYLMIQLLDDSIVKKINNRTIEQSNNVKLWLYDIVSPKQYFSSYDYVSCAIPVIQDILSRGKTPIIVGGTYFYLYHLLYNVQTEHIKPNWKLRDELNTKSISELQSILNAIAPQFINELSRSEFHNPQRLIRKIEISRSSSYPPYFPLSRSYQITLKKKLNLKNLDIRLIGICFKDKEKLRQQITKRVEKRIQEGAIEEVKRLLEDGYSENDPGLKTIGYQQMIKFVKNIISFENAKKEWITKELQYAKRQYTFMKKDPHIIWSQID